MLVRDFTQEGILFSWSISRLVLDRYILLFVQSDVGHLSLKEAYSDAIVGLGDSAFGHERVSYRS